MSTAVLRAAAEFAFAAAPPGSAVEFLWHAGEPLAAGLPFYRDAFAVIADTAPDAAVVRHTLQTNATLVTPRWCEVFREHEVGVGISIDGPRELHDTSRKTWGGSGTHDRTMRGYRCLRACGIETGAICVLTRESLRHADAIYDFFRTEGFTSIAFNVDETVGARLCSSLRSATLEDIREAYCVFMRQLWRRWRADGGDLIIRDFAHVLSCIHDVHQGFDVEEPLETVPFGILTVTKDGTIGSFAPELMAVGATACSSLAIGNVLYDSPKAVKRRKAFIDLAGDVASGQKACREECEYYKLCGGGFQAQRYAEHGSLRATATLTCQLQRQALADTVLGELLAESPSRSRPTSINAPTSSAA